LFSLFLIRHPFCYIDGTFSYSLYRKICTDRSAVNKASITQESRVAKPSIIKTSENPLQTIEVEVYDEYGEKLVKSIACERPLTVLLNWKEIISFVEDVGRHNAVDTLAGEMWLNGMRGDDKIFYTTGRLTSEMVIKVAQMGIPLLLSRSGVTQMGLELAQRFGITTIARASGRRFHVYSGADKVVFDVKGHSEEA
jgi:formate dehydrogenase accessory protein FdhD